MAKNHLQNNQWKVDISSKFDESENWLLTTAEWGHNIVISSERGKLIFLNYLPQWLKMKWSSLWNLLQKSYETGWGEALEAEQKHVWLWIDYGEIWGITQQRALRCCIFVYIWHFYNKIKTKGSTTSGENLGLNLDLPFPHHDVDRPFILSL